MLKCFWCWLWNVGKANPLRTVSKPTTPRPSKITKKERSVSYNCLSHYVLDVERCFHKASVSQHIRFDKHIVRNNSLKITQYQKEAVQSFSQLLVSKFDTRRCLPKELVSQHIQFDKHIVQIKSLVKSPKIQKKVRLVFSQLLASKFDTRRCLRKEPALQHIQFDKHIVQINSLVKSPKIQKKARRVSHNCLPQNLIWDVVYTKNRRRNIYGLISTLSKRTVSQNHPRSKTKSALFFTSSIWDVVYTQRTGVLT